MQNGAAAGCDDERPAANWYAVYTKHQHEKVVARNLAGKRFEIFLPLYASARSWKDRVKVLSLPLFPCYVFLKGDLERRLEIVMTPGVHALVSYSSRPAVIPSGEIEDIRKALGSGLGVEPHPFLECGDWVRVKCGPLAGIRGILVRKRDAYRVVLSVEMLGQAAAVEVDAALLEHLVGKPPAASSALSQSPRIWARGAAEGRQPLQR